MTPPGLIGTPAQEMVWTESFESFLRLRPPAGSHVQVESGLEPLPEKRDELAELCLEVPRWRWLLFLDSDQTFPCDVAQRLWRTAEETGAGVVAAPVVRRSKWAALVAGGINAWRLPDSFRAEDPANIGDDPNLRDDAEQLYAPEIDRDGEPFDVDLVGAGVTLIRREVLEAVEGPPWFPPSRVEQPGKCEDINFVHRAKLAGFRVVVDPRVRVGHVGPCAYEVEDAARGSIQEEPTASVP